MINIYILIKFKFDAYNFRCVNNCSNSYSRCAVIQEESVADWVVNSRSDDKETHLLERGLWEMWNQSGRAKRRHVLKNTDGYRHVQPPGSHLANKLPGREIVQSWKENERDHR